MGVDPCHGAPLDTPRLCGFVASGGVREQWLCSPWLAGVDDHGGRGSASSATSAPPRSGTPSQSSSPPSGRADRCHSSQLAATDDGGQGGAGKFFGQVVFGNISAQACTVFGYPGLQRLAASRAPLPTKVIRLPDKPPSLVTLAPQEQAPFGYSYCGGCGTSTDDQGTCTPVPTAFVDRGARPAVPR
ncbi:MAG: DUF4232 domain-containing protein [Acidimicrobiales bacterium]